MKTTTYPSPALSKKLNNTFNMSEIDRINNAEGVKGSFFTPSGAVIEYEGDGKEIRARIRVDSEVEAQYLAEAKHYREIEKKGQTPHGINGFTFCCSPLLDTELQAMGLDYFGALHNHDQEMLDAIHRVVERQFKHYKATNRKLI